MVIDRCPVLHLGMEVAVICFGGLLAVLDLVGGVGWPPLFFCFGYIPKSDVVSPCQLCSQLGP